MAKNKTIKVECAGSRSIPMSELMSLQENLVELKEKNFKKLKRLLIKFGFRFPVFVWNNKIIDGHQRLFVLKHLIENEGYLFPHDVPVCDIEAKDEKEAKELLLVARSEYGKMTNEGLYEFIETGGLSFPDLSENLSFPDINFDEFRSCFYGEYAPPKPDGIDDGNVSAADIDKKSKELYDKMNKKQDYESIICPQCGHEFEVKVG